MPDLVEVTQEDREAAADLGKLTGWPTLFRLRTRDGALDAGPVVQSFARHRLASEARLTQLMEALEKIAAGDFNCAPRQYYIAAQAIALKALCQDTTGGGDGTGVGKGAAAA